jgi:hypothetical protein
VKVGAILVTHDLKAARDGLDNWRLGILVLTQAGHACFAADRTPESLVPSDGYSQGRGPALRLQKSHLATTTMSQIQPNMATAIAVR